MVGSAVALQVVAVESAISQVATLLPQILQALAEVQLVAVPVKPVIAYPGAQDKHVTKEASVFPGAPKVVFPVPAAEL